MNTTRGILNTTAQDLGARPQARRAHDPAAAAPVRTHGAHGRTSRAERTPEPAPFDKAMQEARRDHTGPDNEGARNAAPEVARADGAHAGEPNVHTDGEPVAAPACGETEPCTPGEAQPKASVEPPRAEPPADTKTLPDAAQMAATGVSGDAQQDSEAVQSTLGALLSAPLTVHNLNALLATIDPRLATGAPVRLATADGAGASQSSGELARDAYAAASAQSLGEDAAEAAPARDEAARPDSIGALDRGTSEGQALPHELSAVDGDERVPTRTRAASNDPHAAAPAETSSTNAVATSVALPAGASASAGGAASAVEPAARSASETSAPAPGGGVPGTVGASHAGGLSALVGGHQTGSDRGLQGQHAATLRAHSEAQNETFTGQVSRGLAAALRQGADGSVTIRLHPASLGQVRVRVAVDGNKVDVRFAASSDQARALLSSSLGSLREGVERRGFSIESLAVEDDNAGSERRMDAVQQPGTQATQDANAGTRPNDHGGSAVPGAFDQGQGDPGGRREGHGGAERRQGEVGGPGAAGKSAASDAGQDARGAVRVVHTDGVQDQLGRLLMRLDALA